MPPFEAQVTRFRETRGPGMDRFLLEALAFLCESNARRNPMNRHGLGALDVSKPYEFAWLVSSIAQDSMNYWGAVGV